MNPTPSKYSALYSAETRQIALIAEIAMEDTISGGARALAMAAEMPDFSDGLTVREIVNEVYSRSTGRTCKRFGAWECNECGSVHLGFDSAAECCAETEMTDEEFASFVNA